jgi:hypothetical protein
MKNPSSKTGQFFGVFRKKVADFNRFLGEPTRPCESIAERTPWVVAN